MKRNLIVVLTILVVMSMGASTILAKEYMIVGYAFQRGTDISKLDVSKVTHINYSFGLIHNDEYLQINPATGLPWGTPANPDVRTPEPVPEGKLHTIYLPEKVASDLSRLDELWAKNPDLKVLLSVGGWDARGFCDAAATEESRKIFAQSCKAVVETYNLAGIDLDWEYPVIAGWGVIKGTPEDRHNFTLLLQEVRNAIGPDKLLTIAGSANLNFTTAWTEFKEVIDLLDYINIMTYDFQYDSYYGSALYSSEIWPTPPASNYYADMAIKNYIASGCPPEKINLGMAFAAPIPSVVQSSPAYSEIRAKLEAAGYYSSTLPRLQRIPELLENINGFMKKWDEDAQNMYISTILEDGTEHFVLSYIEPTSITAKNNYVKEHGLSGVFFWEFGADYDNLIVTQLHKELILEP